MSNTTPTTDASGGQLFCPLLEMMKEHRHNNNTQVNLVVVCIHGTGLLPGDFGERPHPLGGGLPPETPHSDIYLGAQSGHV
ncbi:hypothetical protein CesoFtcFv8_009368 [Champsocephalus esox]|uniref:Uncharacterized protein n=1 Tax=Champsocephalus esox TaxID=159716 RepID=A0AAN8H2E5_9TELE|nr:hypothetical protein CesoFtcFv8_009368 [Champsocephalus esox]